MKAQKRRKAILKETLSSLVNVLVFAGLMHLCVMAEWITWDTMWPVLAGYLLGLLLNKPRW